MMTKNMTIHKSILDRFAFKYFLKSLLSEELHIPTSDLAFVEFVPSSRYVGLQWVTISNDCFLQWNRNREDLWNMIESEEVFKQNISIRSSTYYQ